MIVAEVLINNEGDMNGIDVPPSSDRLILACGFHLPPHFRSHEEEMCDAR